MFVYLDSRPVDCTRVETVAFVNSYERPAGAPSFTSFVVQAEDGSLPTVSVQDALGIEPLLARGECVTYSVGQSDRAYATLKSHALRFGYKIAVLVDDNAESADDALDLLQDVGMPTSSFVTSAKRSLLWQRLNRPHLAERVIAVFPSELRVTVYSSDVGRRVTFPMRTAPYAAGRLAYLRGEDFRFYDAQSPVAVGKFDLLDVQNELSREDDWLARPLGIQGARLLPDERNAVLDLGFSVVDEYLSSGIVLFRGGDAPRKWGPRFHPSLLAKIRGFDHEQKG